MHLIHGFGKLIKTDYAWQIGQVSLVFLINCVAKRLPTIICFVEIDDDSFSSIQL